MADYYTNFSLILRLPTKDAQQYALRIAEQARADVLPETFPVSLREVIEDWYFDTEASDEHHLWLHSSAGGIDAVCAFIQHLLQRFDPTGRIAFEWSHDCSKPRIDAFGGGAAIVTTADVHSMTTAEWLQAQS